MMDLKRLKIYRHGKNAFAVDDECKGESNTFVIVNTADIPEGMKDGIFTVDRRNNTARFESRKAAPGILFVARKEPKELPRAHKQTLPDGTGVLLLDGAVSVTRTVGGVYVDAEGLSEDAKRLLAGLALEGADHEVLARALRYVK